MIVLRDDGLLPGTFVFPSRTQKAADENRRSQKPPAAWIYARTFGKQSISVSRLTEIMIGAAMNVLHFKDARLEAGKKSS